MSLGRDQILAALAGFQSREVDVPELGGKVRVRPVSIEAVARLHRAGAASHQLIAEAVCDDTGALLFGAGDAEAIGRIPAGVAQRLMEAINEVSGLTPKASDEAAGK